MDLDLPQGQYNILPSTFDKGVETNFVLRAIGPADVTLTPTTDNWKELTFSVRFHSIQARFARAQPELGLPRVA